MHTQHTRLVVFITIRPNRFVPSANKTGDHDDFDRRRNKQKRAAVNELQAAAACITFQRKNKLIKPFINPKRGNNYELYALSLLREEAEKSNLDA